MQLFQLNMVVKLINSYLVTMHILAPFCFHITKTANISQINQQSYSKCSKCPPSAFTQARRRFLKLFAIDLQIASCTLVVTRPRYSEALTSVSGCSSAADLFTKQNDVIVMSLLSWYSVSWYSVANRILTDKKYTAACSLKK